MSRLVAKQRCDWARRLILASLPAMSLFMGGCAQFGGLDSDYNPFAAAKAPEEPVPGQLPASELQLATDHWGQEFAKNPRDLKIALSYARNLKALGDKKRAASVLKQASLFHATDKELNSELGRLALELNQVAMAKKLLEAADDPAKPDWRVLSARGTIMAKEGRTAEAIAFFERADSLSPNQPSVLNNLALAHAMNGDAEKAEEILRSAEVSGPSAAKVRQNLALVLGLQGKYDEATKVGSEVVAPATATANTDLLKKMVKLEPKPMAPVPSAPVTEGWGANIAVAPKAVETGWTGQVILPAKQAIASNAGPTQQAPVTTVAASGAPVDLRPAAR